MLPTSLIIIRNRPSKGGYVCPESEFQNPSFLVLRRRPNLVPRAFPLKNGWGGKPWGRGWRRPCYCQDFTIVFVLLFPVAVAVSTHLCVVCRHFCCPISLFQGHFASVSKFSLTAPEESSQNKCNQRRVS